MSAAPIGIYDSGVGGLSVWRELRRSLPEESLLYLGDGKNCPYGDKSREQIVGYAEQAVETLVRAGCKLVVVACNTATAAAIAHLREIYDIPLVGMEPAVKPAVELTRSGVVAVLATARSLDGEHFSRALENYGDKVTILPAVGEGFVELVEGAEAGTPRSLEAVRTVLDPLIAHGADTIVLGCTHYPLLAGDMQAVIGERDVRLIDPAGAVARRVGQLLDQYGTRSPAGSVPKYSFASFAGGEYVARLKEIAARIDTEGF